MQARAFQLQYDIPQPNGIPVCANPSGELYAAGCIRTTDSVWIVREEDLNGRRMMLLLDFLTRRGVIWFTLAFDVSQAEKIRALATLALKREIAERQASAEETRRIANERFADESNSNYKARRRVYLAAARHLEAEVAGMLRRMAFAASRFGIGEGEIRAREIATDMETIAGNMKDRAAAFAQAHGILTRQARGNPSVALVSTAFNEDAIPIGPVADFLRDECGEEGESAADDIVSSFGLA